MVPQLWVVRNFVEGRPAEIRKTVSSRNSRMFVKQFFHSSSIPDNNRRVYSTEATEKGYTQAH
jgi:hypothetical protein